MKKPVWPSEFMPPGTRMPSGSRFEKEHTVELLLGAEGRLAELFKRAAQGDEDAATALAWVVGENVQSMNSLKPQVLRRAARVRNQWPYCMELRSLCGMGRRKSSDPGSFEFRHATSIELGRDCMPLSQRRRWTHETTAAKYAIDLFGMINYVRHMGASAIALWRQLGYRVSTWATEAVTLPPPSKSTIDEWWRIAKGILEDYLAKNPMPADLAALVKGYPNSKKGRAVLLVSRSFKSIPGG